MESEQTMSLLKPAAKEPEPLQSTGAHPLPAAHPNTSGNAHGQHRGGWGGEESHETTNEDRSWSQLVDEGCSEHWGSPRAGGEASWAREAQKALGGCWKGRWVKQRWGNRRKWANLQERAGFEWR